MLGNTSHFVGALQFIRLVCFGFFCVLKTALQESKRRCHVVHFTDENWGPEKLLAQCCVPVKQ